MPSYNETVQKSRTSLRESPAFYATYALLKNVLLTKSRIHTP